MDAPRNPVDELAELLGGGSHVDRKLLAEASEYVEQPAEIPRVTIPFVEPEGIDNYHFNDSQERMKGLLYINERGKICIRPIE